MTLKQRRMGDIRTLKRRRNNVVLTYWIKIKTKKLLYVTEAYSEVQQTTVEENKEK